MSDNRDLPRLGISHCLIHRFLHVQCINKLHLMMEARQARTHDIRAAVRTVADMLRRSIGVLTEPRFYQLISPHPLASRAFVSAVNTFHFRLIDNTGLFA